MPFLLALLVHGPARITLGKVVLVDVQALEARVTETSALYVATSLKENAERETPANMLT